MGKKFGELAYVRHQVYFTLSPFEQKPFAKFFSVGIGNSLRRIGQEAPVVIFPLLAGYALFTYTRNKAVEMHTKEYIQKHGH
jgi:ubiquinol-cytochrome c reductase subunit 8